MHLWQQHFDMMQAISANGLPVGWFRLKRQSGKYSEASARKLSDKVRRADWRICVRTIRYQTAKNSKTVIYDHLESEYNYVLELQKTYGTLIAPKMSFFMSLSPAQYIAKMHHPVLRRVKRLNITAEMDLLALSHEYRMPDCTRQYEAGSLPGLSGCPFFRLLFRLNQTKWISSEILYF